MRLTHQGISSRRFLSSSDSSSRQHLLRAEVSEAKVFAHSDFWRPGADRSYCPRRGRIAPAPILLTSDSCVANQSYLVWNLLDVSGRLTQRPGASKQGALQVPLKDALPSSALVMEHCVWIVLHAACSSLFRDGMFKHNTCPAHQVIAVASTRTLEILCSGNWWILERISITFNTLISQKKMQETASVDRGIPK